MNIEELSPMMCGIVFFLTNVAGVLSLVMWGIFYTQLTSMCGCGPWYYESAPGFPKSFLGSAIYLTICHVVGAYFCGNFAEALRNVLLLMILMFAVLPPIIGILTGGIEIIYSDLIAGVPSVIAFELLYRNGVISIANGTIAKIIMIVVGSALAICAFVFLLLVTSAVRRIEDFVMKRKKRKEAESFAKFVADNGIVKSISTTNGLKEEFEKLRGAREIGPQLRNYLLNYGYLTFGSMKLCGIGKDIDEELDMTVRTKEFRKVSDIDDERIVMVLEIIDENIFAVIDRRFDAVAYYNIAENRFSNCDKTNKKIGYDFKLYDYIRMRVEEEGEKMSADVANKWLK